MSNIISPFSGRACISLSIYSVSLLLSQVEWVGRSGSDRSRPGGLSSVRVFIFERSLLSLQGY